MLPLAARRSSSPGQAGPESCHGIISARASDSPLCGARARAAAEPERPDRDTVTVPRTVPVTADASDPPSLAGPGFGLWRIRFPPVLVRTGRRLPVQALGERGVLVSLTGYPRGGAPGPG